MRKIELPSEGLAKELQRHLQERKFAVQNRSSETIQFPDDMKPSEWSTLKSAIEKWASGRQLKVVESLRIESSQTTKEKSKAQEDERLAEVKKLDSFTPQMAEQRYKYLQRKPIGELTVAEYDERLALAQRGWKRDRKEGN